MVNELDVIDYLRVDIQVPGADSWIWGKSRWDIDSFGLDSDTLEWTDYTCELTNATLRRGVAGDLISNRPEPGRLNLTFKGAANPLTDTAIHPNIGVRLVYTPAPELVIFTGRILDVQLLERVNKQTNERTIFTTITAVDAVPDLTNTTRYGAGAVGGYEKWEERIERLAASSIVPVTLPIEGTPVLKYAYDYYDFDGTASGDGLDYWTRFGTYPSGVTGSIQQTAVNGTFPGQVVGVGIQSDNGFAYPKTLAADTYGAERTITGLTIGKTYKLNMGLAYVDPTSVYALGTVAAGEHFSKYKIGVQGIGHSAEVDLRTGTVSGTRYLNAMPEYEFTATATTHVIEYILSTAATRTAASSNPILESVVGYNVDLTETASAYDERLQSLKMETSLARHFSIACDSVGAFWHIDRDNNVKFTRILDSPGPALVFTDIEALDGLKYTDIKTNYDSRDIVNTLDIYNHGIKDDPENPGSTLTDDTVDGFTDETSIATWGSSNGTIDTSLYTGAGHETALADRAAEILDAYQTPKQRFTWLRWNAADDIEAIRKLEIYKQITVAGNYKIQDYRITNIYIEMAPRRCMVDLDIIPEPGTLLTNLEL